MSYSSVKLYSGYTTVYSLKYTGTVYAMLAVFTIMSSYTASVITAVFVEQPILNVVSLYFKLVGIKACSK